MDEQELIEKIANLDRDAFWGNNVRLLLASYSREARIETLQQVLSNQFHTFQPVGGISNIQYIARSDVDRQLKTLRESKQNLSEEPDNAK